MQLRPLMGHRTHSKRFCLTDEAKHLTINTFFTQFGLTVKEKNEFSSRMESCKAYSLTRNCTTLNHHYPCTQRANDSKRFHVTA